MIPGTLSLLLAFLAATCPAAVAQAADTGGGTAVLVDLADPYYMLAEEIARQETLPIAHSVDEALAIEPEFLLWVVSPGRLSEQVLADFALAARDRRAAISVGILSGVTLDDARALWRRAAEVEGNRVVVANAANPAGHIPAGITSFGAGSPTVVPLTEANLIRTLQEADYVTFTGHGGAHSLRLDKETALEADEIPLLPPVVVATGSCRTFRPWTEGSLPLAFIHQGAAAYAGFVHSPNEGFLIGEFDGLPFRYTWPEFPVGHAVQVQNRGTLQGFAQFPYYFLMGDPRIALQSGPPYRLLQDQTAGDGRTLAYSDTQAGVLPVRIPGGARYRFVEIPGVSAASDGDWFYNSRLQMVNIGDDRLVLFEHQGGPFRLELRTRPPWGWAARDVLADALDTTLLFLPDGDSAPIYLAVGGLALVPAAWRLYKKQSRAQTLATAALVGLLFAGLHGLYATVRLDQATITSKAIEFGPLSLTGTWLLITSGALLFFTARSWLGRGVGLFVALFGAAVPAAFILGVVSAMNLLVNWSGLGVGVLNYRLGLQPLLVLGIGLVAVGTVFIVVREKLTNGGKRNL